MIIKQLFPIMELLCMLKKLHKMMDKKTIDKPVYQATVKGNIIPRAPEEAYCKTLFVSDTHINFNATIVYSPL